MEARLLWIGEPWKTGDTDKKVLLYFHGGGFILPLFKGHLELSKFLKEQLASYGENVSVACLEYCKSLGSGNRVSADGSSPGPGKTISHTIAPGSVGAEPSPCSRMLSLKGLSLR
jgi:hypothetical protein